MEKALYVRGHVFNYSSQFGQSLSAIYNVMQVWHQREQWDPGSAKDLEPTKENLAVIYSEKRQAVEQAQKLRDILDPGTLGLPEAFLAEIEAMLELYVLYARGYELSAHAYFSAQRALKTGEPIDAESALANADALDAFQGELARHLEATVYPHYVYWLTSPTRLHQLADDIRQKLNPKNQIA